MLLSIRTEAWAIAKYLGLLAATLGLLQMPSGGRAEEGPITLTLATWGASSHPHEREFVERFIATAVRESQGRLAFRYFPNGSMVKQDDVVSSVPGGLVDIALMIIDSWAGINHDVSITATPLWTLSMEDARSRLAAGQPLFDYFSNVLLHYDVKLLCLLDIGPPVIASKFSLTRPKELGGKVVRAMSKGSAEDLRALGSSPVVMGVGQVYAALQRQTVDGAMNGIQGSIGLRYYEVAGYEIATGGALGTIVSGYIMNLRKFRSLPPELQSAITRAADETRAHTQDYLIRTYGGYLAEARKRGMNVFELRRDTSEWDDWERSLDGYKREIRQTYSSSLLRLIP
jgi:TRAP-type C4-dicarboxylate transport system substrate-binding protein